MIILNIKSLLNSINIETELDFEVNDIAYDSRKVLENDIFVCLRGSGVDGHDYAVSACEKGAKFVIAEENLDLSVPVAVVKDTKKALAILSAEFFGRPYNKLKTIGITGTKGKTTTAFMIKSILESAGQKVGVIGTIGVLIGDELTQIANTTPESYLVQKYMAEMLEKNCQYLVMEVSSIGLRDYRVHGFDFDCAVFTNFSQDHIGGVEHESMEEYFNCKAMLFSMCKHAVINTDDAKAQEIIGATKSSYTSFGFNKADIIATENHLQNGQGKIGSFLKTTGKVEESFDIAIPGKFNAYNALSAIAVANHFGISLENIKQGLATVKVKGRVEPVKISDDFTLLLDYAHNAISMQNILNTLREYNPNRLVCLFGAGGNRPKVRRYEMGETSGNLADLSVITADNSRFENVLDIIEDIKIGMHKTKGEYIVIPDRKEAIKYVIENAQKGDIIVLAGKGHEDYQDVMGKKSPFDERVVIADIMTHKL